MEKVYTVDEANEFEAHLVEEAQKMDKDMTCAFFINKNLLCFIRDGIIIYGIQLTKENIEVPIQEHIDTIKGRLQSIDSGLISEEDMKLIREKAKGLSLDKAVIY